MNVRKNYKSPADTADENRVFIQGSNRKKYKEQIQIPADTADAYKKQIQDFGPTRGVSQTQEMDIKNNLRSPASKAIK